MVSFSFRDNNDRLICIVDPSKNLPDEAAVLEVSGPYDNNRRRYKVFTTMLKNSPKILERIDVSQLSAESPEFLSFLGLIFSKTKSLKVEDSSLSSIATAAVLMTALLPRDGIRHLTLRGWYRWRHQIATDQMKILLEGVASSLCLETLSLQVYSFEDAQAVGRYLIQALRRNQSLKEISLYVAHFMESDSTFLPKVLEASIYGAKVKSVSIQGNGERSLLQIGALEDILCREDCVLEKLNLEDMKVSTGDGEDWFWSGSALQNKSVTNLSFSEVSFPHGATEIVTQLKSLVVLDLCGTELDELSFLDPFLSEERSQLKSLDLSHTRNRNVTEGEIIRFIEKLRMVKGLKHFSMYHDEWDFSDSVTTALNDVLKTNTDLELVGFYDIDLPFDLNRAGRRVFEPSLESFPTNLLPRVLERASKISYYEWGDSWGSPQNEKPRLDVVFWMVQRIAPHLGATAEANNQTTRSSQDSAELYDISNAERSDKRTNRSRGLQDQEDILVENKKRRHTRSTRETSKKKRETSAEELD